MKALLLIAVLLNLIYSAPINDTIDCVKAYINGFEKDLDPKIFTIFKKAFPNTL
mgnify:CR=1 FL=1|jgi:hypothetical protein